MTKCYVILMLMFLSVSCSNDDDVCGCKTFQNGSNENVTLFTCADSLEFATNPNEDVQELIDMCK